MDLRRNVKGGERARTVALLTPIVAAAAAVAALAGAGPPAEASLGPAPEPSKIVYGDATIPLHFDHAAHMKQIADCSFCHRSIQQSTSAQTMDLPREADCMPCHHIDRAQPAAVAIPPISCVTCHAGWTGGQGAGAPPPVVLPSPDLKFNHKIHLDRGVPCATCHGDVAQKSRPLGRQDLPRMSTCLQCHDGRSAPSACSTCHLANPDGTLVTALSRGQLLPTGQLWGDAHDLTFRTSHAAVAKANERYCLSCHKEKECLQCHEGVVKPFDFHGNDYITLHPIDAKRDEIKCASCHRRQSFCIGCHAREGVAIEPVSVPGNGPYDPTGGNSLESPFRMGTLSFHPVYSDGRAWVTVGGTFDQNQHALGAERNMSTCVSCHTERFCMNCHADAELSLQRGGILPHGPDWISSGRCQALAARNSRMCLQCHARTNPNFQADLACEAP